MAEDVNVGPRRASGVGRTGALETEDDVRTKVVADWLASHGFAQGDLRIEAAFDVTLGRRTLRVDSRADGSAPGRYRPRADLVVRHADGRNLLVIETKAPGEPLDEHARRQGISYARLLQNGGGIAPFVVVTNGRESAVYDALTEERVDAGSDGAGVPPDHAYARRGFRVAPADLAYRAEALETLVSLSPENLIAFCDAQIAYRTRTLRSDDPRSGLKYIPALHTPRPAVESALAARIDAGDPVILLVGPPQQGKTSLLCNIAERRLIAGEPVLFYPAVAIGGLIEELRADFEWTFHHALAGPTLVAERLTRVALSAGRRLVVLIDGWNEAAGDAARAIDAEGDRIASSNVTLVVSLTTSAAERLLIDVAGNPARLAAAAGITPRTVALIANGTRWDTARIRAVRVGEFDAHEAADACARAAAAYGVTVPETHVPARDPLLSRTAIEAAKDGVLPPEYDEPDLLARRLAAKIGRAGFAAADTARAMLTTVAAEIMEVDGAVDLGRLHGRLSVPLATGLPPGLFDAALLARRPAADGRPGIDFYYSRDRHYVIAYWVARWPNHLADGAVDLHARLATAVRGEVAEEALRWFLGRPAHAVYLQHALAACADSWGALDVRIRRLLLSCTWEQAAGALTTDEPGVARTLSADATAVQNSMHPEHKVERSDVAPIADRRDDAAPVPAGAVPDGRALSRTVLDDAWFALAAETGARDADPIVKANAAKLFAVLADRTGMGDDRVADLLTDERELLRELLSIDQTVSLDADGAGRVVLDALRGIDDPYGWEDDTPLTHVLAALTQDPSPVVREAAATAYGYVAPLAFLRWAGQIMTSHPGAVDPVMLNGVERGIELAADDVHGQMFGDMCPGYWNVLREDANERGDVFVRYQAVFTPILRAIRPSRGANLLRAILDTLAPSDMDVHDEGSRVASCACQLSLELNGADATASPPWCAFCSQRDAASATPARRMANADARSGPPRDAIVAAPTVAAA